MIHKEIYGYVKIFNNIITPIELLFSDEKYKEIIALCDEGRDRVKDINGNHFHILLFIDLKEMISELL